MPARGAFFGDLLQPHILYLIIIFSSLTFEDEASGVVSPVGGYSELSLQFP